jgi:hypothetical protein
MIKCKEFGHFVGTYKIEAFDKDGNPATFLCNGEMIHSLTKKNIITQAFYDRLFKFLNASADTPTNMDLNITHMAIGTSTTAPARTDIKLGSETFRLAISSKSYTNSAFTAKMFLNTSQGNTTIREMGTFVNSSDTADSGTLISHLALNVTKTSSISLLVTWILTLAQA